MMATVLISDRRVTSLRIVSRELTAKTPGPDSCRVASAIPATAAAAANSRRMSAIAASWPSVSEPSARVCTSSITRSPSRETQTPSRLAGWTPPSRLPSSSTSSPVGSRASNGFSISPAGDATRSMLLAMAARKPSTVKRSGLTAGLSR